MAATGAAMTHGAHRSIFSPPGIKRPVLPTAPPLDMQCTCVHVAHMTAMIQIRNVPDQLHRRLKSRAALSGMSLSDYLLREIRQVAERPTPEELRERVHRRAKVMLSVSPADAVRAERDHA
jgi:antitoxin FitA